MCAWFDAYFKGTGSSVIKATATHTPVTYDETVKQGIDLDGDGLYDRPGESEPVIETKGKLDDKGKQVYVHTAVFSVEDAAGISMIDTVSKNGDELPAAEWASGAVSMIAGDIITLTDTENTQYSIQLSEDGNMYFSASSIISGAITDINSPYATVNGIGANENLKLYRNVTLARQDYKANTIQIKVNAEEIDVKGIENNKDKPEIPDIPVTPPDEPEQPAPEIRTTAKDSETGERISFADDKVTVIDTVSYKNLLVGKECTLKGTIKDKATGKTLKDTDGKAVTATKTFIPDKTDGTIDIEFTFNGSELAGKTIVGEILF